MIKSALRTASHFELEPESNVLLSLPAHYIAGKMMIVRGIVNGWNLFAEEPSSAPLNISHSNIDFAALTPHQMQLSLEKHPSIQELKCKVILGGAKVNKSLSRMIKSSRMKIYETYGMTETATHIAVKEIHPNPEDAFKCLPGVQYTLEPDNTLGFELQGWKRIETNDIAEAKDMKQFILRGRKDHVINSGGVKIHPTDVEETLTPHLDDTFYITSSADDVLGESVTLVLESDPLPDNLEKLTLDTLNHYLDRFEKIKKVQYLNPIPKTSSGKIKRQRW
ncbi:MAG: AMP-binding protein [Flavobacteriales bacterium]|nr:AMP-binding protein [Flavobacteriales bacterium]